MNIQEQYFKGVPDYYPSMYLDGYIPQRFINTLTFWKGVLVDISKSK